jgi:hypothetical protein
VGSVECGVTVTETSVDPPTLCAAGEPLGELRARAREVRLGCLELYAGDLPGSSSSSIALVLFSVVVA